MVSFVLGLFCVTLSHLTYEECSKGFEPDKLPLEFLLAKREVYFNPVGFLSQDAQ